MTISDFSKLKQMKEKAKVRADEIMTLILQQAQPHKLPEGMNPESMRTGIEEVMFEREKIKDDL